MPLIDELREAINQDADLTLIKIVESELKTGDGHTLTYQTVITAHKPGSFDPDVLNSHYETLRAAVETKVLNPAHQRGDNPLHYGGLDYMIPVDDNPYPTKLRVTVYPNPEMARKIANSFNPDNNRFEGDYYQWEQRMPPNEESIADLAAAT